MGVRFGAGPNRFALPVLHSKIEAIAEDGFHDQVIARALHLLISVHRTRRWGRFVIGGDQFAGFTLSIEVIEGGSLESSTLAMMPTGMPIGRSAGGLTIRKRFCPATK